MRAAPTPLPAAARPAPRSQLLLSPIATLRHAARRAPFQHPWSCSTPTARPTEAGPCTSPVATAASDRGSGDTSDGPPPGGDPYESLWKSKVFSSELVMKELDEIVSQMMQLSSMSSKFPEFDVEGKKMFLVKMEEMVGRYEVFMGRLELQSREDPHSREYLRFLNAQMLNGGFTLTTMFQGVKQSTVDYRRWVAEEERASVDPERHQQFLKVFKEQWKQSALGRFDMSTLASLQMQSPQAFMRAQKDPNFWMAMKEISTSPSPAVMAKWADHPNIGPFVQEIMRTMTTDA